MILRRAALVGLLSIAGAADALAQLGPPPLGGTAVVPSGASAARPLAQKLSDSLSLLDFGATCDGHTDDSNAVTAAAATHRPITIPGGLKCNAPRALSIWQGSPGLFVGPGKLIDSSGNPHPPISSLISSDPNPGSWHANGANSYPDNCVAGFSCGGQWDFSHVLPPEEWYITDTNGGHTLGAPQVGYAYKPGAIPHVAFFNNSSGWNNDPGDNGGRTAAVFRQTIAQQNGQGDMILNEGEILCSGQGGHPVAAGGVATTNFTANPGCAWEAGDITSLYPQQYQQISEWHLNDGGNDSAAIGHARGYLRQFTGTPTNGNVWADQFVTCNGSIPCDAMTMYTGKWRLGLDFVEQPTITVIPYPIVMGSGQKIALNASTTSGTLNAPLTQTGGDWLTYDAASSTVQLADGGAPVLQLSNPAAAANGTPVAVNHFALGGNASGGPIVMSAVGTDASILMIQADKGGAGLLSVSNGAFVMKQTAPPNGNSYLQVSPGGPNQPFTLQVQSFSPTDLQLIPSVGGATHPVGMFRIDMSTPASSSAACTAGQMTFDVNYEYRCVATNTWKRIALSAW